MCIYSLLSRQRVLKLLYRVSFRQGEKYDSQESQRDIVPFIETFNINTEEVSSIYCYSAFVYFERSFSPFQMEYPIPHYRTFNEFFARRLKPCSRVIASPDDPTVVVSAADSRLSAFDSVEEAKSLWVKGRERTCTVYYLFTASLDSSRVLTCSSF